MNDYMRLSACFGMSLLRYSWCLSKRMKAQLKFQAQKASLFLWRHSRQAYPIIRGERHDLRHEVIAATSEMHSANHGDDFVIGAAFIDLPDNSPRLRQAHSLIQSLRPLQSPQTFDSRRVSPRRLPPPAGRRRPGRAGPGG